MAGSSNLQVLSLCFLTLFGGCLASRRAGYMYEQRPQLQGGQRQQQGTVRGECDLDNLNPIEPVSSFRYEAGTTDFWDENSAQLRCAGVAVTRHVIQSRGLLLPSFNNAPMLVFVIQGNGMLGVMLPGCPETYLSIQESIQGQPGQGQGQGQSQMFMDQHQKIHQLNTGDVIALPTGVSHWAYNQGQDNLVLVVVHDTSNLDNQLDQNLRRFFLAGNPQQQQTGQGGQEQQQQTRLQGINVFQPFDTRVLARAFMISQETARKLQSQNDKRGNIIKVRNDELRVVSPRSTESQQEPTINGLEETICSMRLKENLANPERADVYIANGGSISSLNSMNLPILRNLQLSAGRGVLRPGAMVAPHWNLNSNSISYIASGTARVQIVGRSARPVFDGEVREGQILIIPQNFAHFKEAGNEGCEWFTVKTNDLAKSSPLAGKTSVMRAMPEDVLMNAYRLTREEARRIKYNRQEVTILTPQGEETQQQEQGQGSSIPMSIV